jgi:tRNA A-37 threonylcarbamoyl transferase component Bud32
MLVRGLEAGDRFADYVIVRLIGAGGFGAVYEAEHPILGRRVALKITHPDVAEDADGRARALQEARALAELSHPNIVAIQNAGISPEGQVWIATELLHGWTLREMRSRSGPMPVEQALAVLAEICDGVGAAHDIDIFHRDLKPENVFVTRQIAVKVLDLTAAKAAGRGIVASSGEMPAGKAARKIIGTVAYMSPEQLRGERVDARTDVYSVGVMAHELMGPSHPFANRDGTLPDDYELARRHAEVEPALLTRVAPSVPEYVGKVVAAALAKGREERLPSMKLFAMELRAARARHLEERAAEHVSLAEEWRGAGSFAAYGTTDPRSSPAVARQPSRRVVVPQSASAAPQAATRAPEPPHPGYADQESGAPGQGVSGGPTVIHITAVRPVRHARRSRRGATLAVGLAVAALLAGAALAYRPHGKPSVATPDAGAAR